MIQLIFRHLPAQRIAVNAQQFRGTGLIAVGALQNTLDESFLKFTNGFVEQNAPLHHLSHKAFQLISHVCTLRTYDLFEGAGL